jgi:hypothetical protein
MIEKWLDRPISWRASLRLSWIIAAITLFGFVVINIISFWSEITKRLDALTSLVKRKLIRR